MALATRISSLEFIVESSGTDGVLLTSVRSARRAAVLMTTPGNRGAKDSKSAHRRAALPAHDATLPRRLGFAAN
jgi:hypothetical protein